MNSAFGAIVCKVSSNGMDPPDPASPAGEP
jgi:hypothetical protein